MEPFSYFIFAAVLLVAGLVSISWIQYKQNLRALQAQEKTAEAAASSATGSNAPYSIETAMDNPAAVTEGTAKGVVNQHFQDLGRRTALRDPLLKSIGGMCQEMTETARETFLNGKSDVLQPGTHEQVMYTCKYADITFLISCRTSVLPTEQLRNDNYELDGTQPFTPVITSCKMAVPMGVEGENRQKISDLYSVFMNEYEIAAVEVVAPVVGKLTDIFRIALNDQGVPGIIKLVSKPTSQIPTDILNASYKMPAITINTKTFDPPPVVRAQGLTNLVTSGKNIALKGGPGTGKTRLLDHIAMGLPAEFRLLYLNIQGLRWAVENPNLIHQARGVGKLVVIFDEAQLLPQDAMSDLLQLIDGNMTEKDVTFMLALSQGIDEALRRRIYEFVELEQPTTAMALNLKKAIRNAHPELSMHNERGYDDLAKTGKFTISNLWDFFGPRDMVADLVKLYNPYTTGGAPSTAPSTVKVPGEAK